jgi:hypothetical protein
MRLQDQVCTLKQAAKLAVLEVNKKSLFYYALNSFTPEFKEITMQPDSRDIVYSAFTVSELGIMLPIDFISFKITGGKEFSCSRLKIDNVNIDFSFVSKFKITEAEARAEMLIHLLENKLIKVEEVNERLK